MKEEKIFEGKTVEDAIAAGCKELGVSREDVEVEVVEVPSKGFLGFGGTGAKVKLTYEIKADETAPKEKALKFLKALLEKMGVSEPEFADRIEDGKLMVEIKGQELGYLIGRHGETLDAMQYLVSVVANRGNENGEYLRVILDVENYRAKREETLKALAKRYAMQAIRNRRNITLEPMTPYERSIIHSALQDFRDVSTHSVGTEPHRCVVISYMPASKGRSVQQQSPAK